MKDRLFGFLLVTMLIGAAMNIGLGVPVSIALIFGAAASFVINVMRGM